MSTYEVFQAVFSAVSEMLLYPVLVLLFAALVVSLWCAGKTLGRALSEALLRRRATAT